jgi:hypothetical protein
LPYLQLGGRLGNQLFQWAFAHYCAIQLGIETKLFTDKKSFPNGTNDDLTSIGISCVHFEKPQINNYLGISLASLDKINSLGYTQVSRAITSIFGVMRQKDSHSNIIPGRNTKLITGYFQNIEYILPNKDVLYSELNNVLNSEFDERKNDNFKARNYQVIHVRKGDYLTNSGGYKLLADNFFIENSSRDVPVVIATDSPKSISNLVQKLKPIYVLDPTNTTAWQTLRWMMNADHLVISNSTFSWWGGFLCYQKGGKVISPDPFQSSFPEINRALRFPGFNHVKSVFI